MVAGETILCNSDTISLVYLVYFVCLVYLVSLLTADRGPQTVHLFLGYLVVRSPWTPAPIFHSLAPIATSMLACAFL
jgi:hypothetical protein